VALMRLFFAVPVPPAAAAALAGWCARLQSQRGWHWVAERNWHVTLAFLGETEGRLLNSLGELGDRVAAGGSGGAIALNSLQWWPSATRPRLLAAVADAAGPLAPLRRELAAGLRELGIDFDGKPLRPHVTLLRLERGVLPELFDLPAGAVDIEVESIALYRSERERGETRYRPLIEWELPAPPPVFRNRH
jgi:2'-5' RNA ligase